MGKCKTKAVQPYLRIFRHSRTFRHIQTYPNIIKNIQAYSERCVTLAYSELWYIQNPGIFKTLAHSEPEIYSESRAIQNPGIFRTRGIFRTLSNIYDAALIETANSYNYFHNITFEFYSEVLQFKFLSLFEVLQGYYLLLLTFNIF